MATDSAPVRDLILACRQPPSCVLTRESKKELWCLFFSYKSTNSIMGGGHLQPRLDLITSQRLYFHIPSHGGRGRASTHRCGENTSIQSITQIKNPPQFHYPFQTGFSCVSLHSAICLNVTSCHQLSMTKLSKTPAISVCLFNPHTRLNLSS